MSTIDIRWIQRFNNFDKAVKQLTKFIENYNEKIADEITIDSSNIYYPEFLKLQEIFIGLKEKALHGK